MVLIVDLAFRTSFGISERVFELKTRFGDVLAEIDRLIPGFRILNGID